MQYQRSYISKGTREQGHDYGQNQSRIHILLHFTIPYIIRGYETQVDGAAETGPEGYIDISFQSDQSWNYDDQPGIVQKKLVHTAKKPAGEDLSYAA